MANTMSMADQYEALSKLLQPTQTKDTQGPDAGRQTQVRGIRSSPCDQPDQTPVAQPSGRKASSKPADSIWEDAEVADIAAARDVDASREVPSYEFLYKQAVTSTDAFLGMMDKDASSACCEDLQLRIELPKAKGLSELDLDVQPTQVSLTSPIYFLCLPLPHKIDEKQSSAKWTGKLKQLTISMRIIRDW